MKEQFEVCNFNPTSLGMIEKCSAVLDEYAGMGYDLSLRQLFYQCVSRNWLVNSEKSYKNLGELVSRARLAGLLDWDMIKDRTRSVVTVSHWTSPNSILRSAADSFRIDKWATQPCYVSVLVEKQALEGVLIPVCEEMDVPFSANRGYASSSHFYEMGAELSRQRDRGKECHVLYLGDHDPSGIDMTRDVEERLRLFSYGQVHVNRVALNMEQVRELDPPENPAKITDPRANSYIARFGESSWELDAIEPRALADLVSGAISALREGDLWEEAVERENGMRRDLAEMARTYRFERKGG